MEEKSLTLARRSIPFEEVLTIIYVLVDDWYKQVWMKGESYKMRGRHGFSESEMLTLMLAHDYLPYPGESQYLAYIRANYLKLFPKLVDQPQYNRRSRILRMCMEYLRRYLLLEMNAELESEVIVDTKPVPVIGYKRNKTHSDFWWSADYGVCKSRHMDYYGYKLVMICSKQGIPLVYDLVAANTDERVAAETVLCQLSGFTVLGDKGFIGEEWQLMQLELTANRILTPKRKNQHNQNTKGLDQWLNATRERIEGCFNEIQNVGRHLEHLKAKKLDGIVTRVCAKVSSHLLRLWLKFRLHLDIQDFSIAI